MSHGHYWTGQMKASPSLQEVLLGNTPQYLENSCLCVIVGLDHLQRVSEASGGEQGSGV